MATTLNNDIARAIFLVSKGKGGGDEHLVNKRIVQFLAKKRLLSKAPDILLRLGKIINEEEGRVIAKVSSKNKISEVAKKDLAQALSKRYSGKEVSLIESIDERLLGGFKIEVNDEIIDMTLKNKIKKLQEYLITTK
jgi:F-type H+-transporting ATPase subunit delta